MIYIGLDDTDIDTSRGTGSLARHIAGVLSADYGLLGVTRHQLLVDPRVPYTKNNSASAILLEDGARTDLDALSARVKGLMLDDYYEGSDPGLCVAVDPSAEITRFGRQVQRQVVTQDDALGLAAAAGVPLHGLGGDRGGVIGALAAVGLAASGDDGRYVLVGRSRELTGLQPVSAVLAAGIAAVRTQAGLAVDEGMVQIDRLRPARRGGQPILYVARAQGEAYWQPLKLD